MICAMCGAQGLDKSPHLKGQLLSASLWALEPGKGAERAWHPRSRQIITGHIVPILQASKGALLVRLIHQCPPPKE